MRFILAVIIIIIIIIIIVVVDVLFFKVLHFFIFLEYNYGFAQFIFLRKTSQ